VTWGNDVTRDGRDFGGVARWMFYLASLSNIILHTRLINNINSGILSSNIVLHTLTRWDMFSQTK